MTETVEKEKPKRVYHYTSADGLRGILESQSLWATSLRSVNDSSELHYAIDVFDALVRKWQEIGRPTDTRVLRSFLDQDPDWREAMTVCAFSASEYPDQLSQWRGYCPPEGGYAVEFITEELESQVRASSPALKHMTWRFDYCRYHEAEHEELFRPLLEKYANLYADIGGRGSAWDEFLLLAPFVKHEAFAEEGEWRLVSGKIPVSALDVRTSGAHLLPYAELRVPPVSGATETDSRGHLPIYGVTIGPQANPNESAQGVAAALRKYHRQEPIRTSRIPYRRL